MVYKFKFFFKNFSSPFVFIFLFLSLSSNVMAETQTPEEVLKEILSKIQAASNTSPIVDYVNWSKAYESLPAPRREFMRVDSPESMKEYYRSVLKDPVVVMKEQFQKKLKSVPNAQKPALEQTFARMEKVLGEKTKEMQSRIKDTKYEVGESKIEGSRAVILLKQTYNRIVKTEEVVFERSGKSWLLPSVGMMSGKGQALPVKKEANSN